MVRPASSSSLPAYVAQMSRFLRTELRKEGLSSRVTPVNELSQVNRIEQIAKLLRTQINP